MTTLTYNNLPGVAAGTVSPLSYGTSYAAGLSSWNNPGAYPVAPTPVAAPTPSVSTMGSTVPGVPTVTPSVPTAASPTAGAVDPAATGMGGVGQFLKGTFMKDGGGLNLEAVGALAEGIGALGSLWSGIQANKIAREALSFQKRAYNTNLANQISSYNTALEDRAAARAAQYGTGPASAEAYVNKNKLQG